jgi:hypothetical protein
MSKKKIKKKLCCWLKTMLREDKEPYNLHSRRRLLCSLSSSTPSPSPTVVTSSALSHRRRRDPALPPVVAPLPFSHCHHLPCSDLLSPVFLPRPECINRPKAMPYSPRSWCSRCSIPMLALTLKHHQSDAMRTP